MNLLDLKEFATDRQWEAILAIEEHGTQAKAAISMGIGSRSLERLLAKAKAAASRRGGVLTTITRIFHLQLTL